MKKLNKNSIHRKKALSLCKLYNYAFEYLEKKYKNLNNNPLGKKEVIRKDLEFLMDYLSYVFKNRE
jgi:hypothetical protein